MKKIFLILLHISLFIFIFKINPFLALPFSFEKIFIAIGFIMMLLIKNDNSVMLFSKSYIFLIFTFIYGALISLNYNYQVNHQVYRIGLFVFESLILSFFILRAYAHFYDKNLVFIIKVIFYCILIQSSLIILSFLFPPVFSLLDTITPLEGTNFDEEVSFRIFRGLSNTSGSGHSIVLSLGGLAAFYLLNFEKKKIYYLALFLIFLAVAINGRSGVLIMLILGAIYIFKNFTRNQSIKIIFLSLLTITIGQLLISQFFSSNIRNEEIKNWYSEVFDVFDSEKRSKSTFYSNFENNHIFLPDTYTEIVFGSGFDTDQYLIGKGSDSGIVKNIFSLGLILTILFYGVLIYKTYYSGKELGTNEMFLSIGIIVILILGELKEPFLVKTFLSKIIFMVIIARNYNKSKVYYF